MTSVALALALSGSPAALAACMVWCEDGLATMAVQTTHEGHGARATEVVPEVAPQAHHHNHDVVAAHATAEPASQLPAAPQASDARLMATCTDCCPVAEFASAVGVRAERRDVDAASVAATARVASFDLSLAVQSASPPSPPIPATSSARAPLALRI
jgi:hypothetical protein